MFLPLKEGVEDSRVFKYETGAQSTRCRYWRSLLEDTCSHQEPCKKIVSKSVEYRFDAQEVTHKKIHVFENTSFYRIGALHV